VVQPAGLHRKINIENSSWMGLFLIHCLLWCARHCHWRHAQQRKLEFLKLWKAFEFNRFHNSCNSKWYNYLLFRFI